MEKLIEILNSIKPGVDLTAEKRLIDDGILDSMSIVRLITMLQDEFDVEFTVTDLVPENFNTVEAIMDLIRRLEE